jgi:hypothetical protein
VEAVQQEGEGGLGREAVAFEAHFAGQRVSGFPAQAEGRIDDNPPFLTSNCKRAHSSLAACETIASFYSRLRQVAARVAHHSSSNPMTNETFEFSS